MQMGGSVCPVLGFRPDDNECSDVCVGVVRLVRDDEQKQNVMKRVWTPSQSFEMLHWIRTVDNDTVLVNEHAATVGSKLRFVNGWHRNCSRDCLFLRGRMDKLGVVKGFATNGWQRFLFEMMLWKTLCDFEGAKSCRDWLVSAGYLTETKPDESTFLVWEFDVSKMSAASDSIWENLIENNFVRIAV